VPTLTCDSIELRSVNNNNTSFFCDPRIDAQVKVALQTEVTNPQLSRETWAKVDRDLVDAAPVIPLVIPQNLDFVSIRVGNYQNNPAWGVLLDQLWVG
jgi:peptide/nickel transport system substrate-binding protein